MQGVNLQFQLLSSGRPPSLTIPNSSPTLLIGRRRSLRNSAYLRCGCLSRLRSLRHKIRAQASNANIGAGSYDGGGGTGSHGDLMGASSETSPKKVKPLSRAGYLLSIASVLFICTVAFSLIVFFKGRPSAVIDALAKSGFTAAFTLIFVSEIGDKTFFIAALLAMQYKRALVLLGSMGALSLMTVLSVIIGRIFHSVPAQFQTTLPIGEYSAVALLTFFGLKSIKDAWGFPSAASNKNKETSELGELVEAEELVKEKVAKKLTNPLEILWKSFSLVFFAEWGDRSMLATIALGAAQSPWGVASGAIVGHLIATSIAILGGAFLANYISEKLVGFLGGVLFLIFAAATLLGVF
ncbi:GDT1-like protein 2, chloroplastic [Typha latifolia]|uniref:GDT1-like protein 2, chloroplastic n=1 Tax=Typha latifolia TaxID=4733 RepID=UPI003C300363